MSVVVDVSAIVPLAFADEELTLAKAVVRKLASEGGLVPSLFWFEIWNTLAMSERRSRSTPENTKRFVVLLRKLNLVVDSLPDSERIFLLTRRYSLTAYDAAYLELALRTDSPLATQDKCLIKALAAAGGSLFAAEEK